MATKTMKPTDHYTIISADTHAGGSHSQYREYLDTAYLDDLSQAYGRQGAAQRTARSIRTKLQNSTIADIFQKTGLHEFLTDFIADNTRLGAAIAEQYLT